MKITGKILTHFQSCNSPVDKEGYMYKKVPFFARNWKTSLVFVVNLCLKFTARLRDLTDNCVGYRDEGERNTSYQKRWFVLKANLLFYKDRPNHRDLLGVIVLEGCTVQLCESEEQFAFSLVWSGEVGLRTYKLAAEDQPSQESWIRALLSANHGYLAALAMDLEKQYKEAIKAFPGDPSQQSTLAGPNAERPTQSLIWLNSGTATLSQYPGPGVRAGHGFSTNQMLQAPPISFKPTNKRSPKLWPKRDANVVPINVPAPPQVTVSGPKVEFSELHEDFGKEVKELIAHWLRRGQEDVIQQEDLIDFG